MANSADMNFLNVCRRHLDIFTAEARWNPSNTRLALTGLGVKLDGGYPIAEDVLEQFAANQIVVNHRQDSYAKIEAFARSARRYLRSCGATDAEIADGNRYINALLGQVKKKPKAIANTEGVVAEATETHAKAQLSYDAMYANLVAFRAFVSNVTAWKPNEEHLSLTAIDALIAECSGGNNAVSAGFVPLSTAWNTRDEKLYRDEDSVIATFRLAKEYYKSLYDPKDPQYKTITAKDMRLQDNSR
jgi:hypothetical protein